MFSVAGVAVESGLRMGSGALPGPDLVRAIPCLGLEGLCARVAFFNTKKVHDKQPGSQVLSLRQQLSCRWLYRARAVQLLRFVDSLTSQQATAPHPGQEEMPTIILNAEMS